MHDPVIDRDCVVYVHTFILIILLLTNTLVSYETVGLVGLLNHNDIDRGFGKLEFKKCPTELMEKLPSGCFVAGLPGTQAVFTSILSIM